MTSPKQNSQSSPPIFAWSDCDPADAPPNEYLVDGLIPLRGSHLVIGAPKKGKSQLTAHFVACLISGKPVFGHYEVLKQEPELRILWILTEENRYKVRERIEMNLRGLGLGNSEIAALAETFQKRLVISARSKDSGRPLEDTIFQIEHHAQWLLEEVQTGNFGIVVLDSLRPAHSGEENSSTDMKPVTDLLRELSDYGCSMILHHTGHSYGEYRRSGGDAARGTSDLDAARDTAIHLCRGKFGESLLIDFNHRDDAERYVAVRTTVDREVGTIAWERTGESEDPGTGANLVQMHDLFRFIDSAERPEDLPRLSDCKDIFGDDYNAHIGNMELDGVIESRPLNAGLVGRPPVLLMRPGQFTDEEWAEAEKRHRESKRA